MSRLPRVDQTTSIQAVAFVIGLNIDERTRLR